MHIRIATPVSSHDTYATPLYTGLPYRGIITFGGYVADVDVSIGVYRGEVRSSTRVCASSDSPDERSY